MSEPTDKPNPTPAPTPAPTPDSDPDNAAPLKAARDEAAKYRTQRNDALRRATALETIAKAHGLDTAAADSEAVRNLAISDGKVTDTFQYTPPKPGANSARAVHTPSGSAGQPPATQPDEGLTHEKIAGMKPHEINQNWEKISAFMRDNPKGAKR